MSASVAIDLREDNEAERPFSFPFGLVGLPKADTFELLRSNREGLYWLQEAGGLTFLLLDPFEFVEGFSVELEEAQLGELATDDPTELVVLSIVTLPKERGAPATANLQGPIALNLSRKLGKQIVLQESEYGVRWPVDLNRG